MSVSDSEYQKAPEVDNCSKSGVTYLYPVQKSKTLFLIRPAENLWPFSSFKVDLLIGSPCKIRSVFAPPRPSRYDYSGSDQLKLTDFARGFQNRWNFCSSSIRSRVIMSCSRSGFWAATATQMGFLKI